jgi:hypothetical protein
MRVALYYRVLMSISDIIMLAPIGAYLWSRNRIYYQKPIWINNFKNLQLIELFFGVIFVSLAYSGIHNQWFRHMAQPVDFVLMILLLRTIRSEFSRNSWLYIILIVIGLMSAGLGLFIDKIHYRNAIFSSTQSVIYLLICGIELPNILLKEETIELRHLPEFWLFAALLLYSSGTIIFNASSNYFLRTLPSALLPIPWLAAASVHSIYHILLAKVFLCPKPSSS